MSDTRTRTVTTGAGKPLRTPISSVSNINEESIATTATVSTGLINNNRKFLLKNQLHLNLNVINNENIESVDNLDKQIGGRVQIAAKADLGDQAPILEVVKFKDDVSYLETTTVTTVPQIQQKQQKSILDASKTTTTSISSSVAAAASSSLLNSSPSALAKFNRIIDSTMPATDCYQQKSEKRKEKDKQLLQQKMQQEWQHGIVTTTDSEKHKKIDFSSNYDDDVGLDVEIDDGDVLNVVKKFDKEEVPEAKATEQGDNQIKRNDVHYLLKQLNSFSDIEEIEIVDMKQTRQQQKEQQTQPQPQPQQAVTARALATTTPAIASAAVITHSPTTTSLVIISPSSQSHKESRHVMRRFASLHQQHQHPDQHHYQYQHHHHRLQSEHQPPQQQQKRYYTLNASGGNLLELGDRIDRLNPATDQQYLLQQFDDYLFESCHYLETNYFAATYRTAMIESSSHEFRPSTTTGTRSSPSAASSPQSYEVHEVELPSVICRAPPPPPSPTRRFNTQARLTSSGVQTELTASSLSSTTTSHVVAQSIAKSISGSSGTSACSYASSTEQRRRMPFFKCCYAPIGRWREKRNAAATTIDKKDGACGTSRISQKAHGRNGHGTLETTGTSRSGSQQQRPQQQQKHYPHARNDGSEV